ncbi:unnamed protein product [Hermetia illucens]|uniref:CUE domain-containing protein 2 n=2 Tax=Hermetia illucens TaxID=343691 RepID=A0A7R8YTT3_HERIL|nr:CUE domain-containing protein 2 isoform X2 [Hermetia illucens]CAD7084739.1 unnamed protein product [Hermetia illucens]
MTNIEQQHEIVKNSLFEFVNLHIPGADLSVVDDIVLSYVISILEEASQDPYFDVDGFVEMMSAYFSDFSRIDPATICTWIFQLENELSKLTKTDNGDARNLSLNNLSLSDIIPEVKLRARPPSVSESTEPAQTHVKRVQHLSETSDGGSTDSSSCDFFSDECDVLQEMFPESSYLEVKHCITIAKGDIDSATQILLHRQETGQSLQANSSNLQGAKSATVIDDAELKNRIIARYSYVDKNAANREYKPVVPKVEPKKLVRYRDNKIVSLKGERYTEVRRDDEAELKKPKKPICP